MAELIRLRQQYNKESITRRNALAIASGCTSVVVFIKDNVLYVANLGDSRCILSRDNKAFPLSSDHKPGDHLYKRNSSLPQKEQMIIAWPDVVVEQLKSNKEEFMVLVSDGVSDCISNAELISFVVKTIKTSDKLSKICEQLFA